MALRGTKPENKEKRLKLFLYGPAGIGKTTAAIMFPQAYIIDCEKGTDFYADTIKKSNSVVFQSNNPDDIAEELNQLLTTKHPYKTLIIDPITQVYNAVQEKWTRIFEKNAKSQKEAEMQDFGMRYWGRVKGEFKALQRLIMRLDMNVIITSHQKDQYGTGMQKIGVTFDSMKGEDYIYDLVFSLKKVGEKRMAKTEKERADMGQNKFPDEFEWSYDNFLKFYGKEIIEKESIPIPLASPDQVREINHLLETIKVEDGVVDKWLTKANVDKFEEMEKDTLQKCIDFLKKKITTEKVA